MEQRGSFQGELQNDYGFLCDDAIRVDAPGLCASAEDLYSQ